ncbi:AAA domain-containing protein [Streptomyces sp. ITFR-16]|uniref:AAA domain-containing protein n=1 Tax=Streptomyces sp. ITFR-16 TaxID=3075198 RepID=UPI00288C2BE1|nr:AAA domain-containing protein [Streptomyces sp. ITFR-16]WNI26167.1 AAA domain-containing protein [Streptomyces sp. ITFR-16]
MSVTTVTLRAPLVLVPGIGLDDRLRARAASSAGLPSDLSRIVHDLNQLEDGAAVSISPATGKYRASLLVHTRTYRLRLEATKRGTGYLVKHIDPLRLADHARLAGACLLVRPPAWRMVFELRAVPDGSDAQWQVLDQAWQDLGRVRAEQQGTPAVSEAQSEFLDSVDRLIDATEEITTRDDRQAAPFPYQRLTTTGGKRGSTPRSVYEFRLVGTESPPAGAFVRIQGDTETRGKVSRAVENTVTVRFEQPVSWDRLPARGALELIPSSVIFNKQRQAVAALRKREARNPGLLAAVVEHHVRAIPATTAQPHEDLDPEQLEAFRKALTTEDLLVVLGPPGTGKTRTITEIAHTAATTAGADSGRVLVTSHTNRAVDNVLARLPRDLVVIRVGDESKVHVDVKPLLLEEQADGLSQEIRHAMTQRTRAYEEAAAVEPWADELAARMRQVDGQLENAEAAALRLREASDAAAAPARARLAMLQDRQREADAALQSLFERAAFLQEKARHAGQRSHAFLIGRLYRSRARRREAEFATAHAEIQHLRALGPELRRQAEAAGAEADHAIRDDAAVRAARTALRTAEHLVGQGLQYAYDAADTAVHALRSVVPGEPEPPRLPHAADAAAALHALHRRLRDWLPLLAQRGELARQWQAAVGQEPGQLVPELVRYAQVVGATCIGAASRPELSGVDFDLGIVDEAGQIGVADTLVPLTRVRRGVLVGDDRQLPPFRDSEVDEWAKENGDPEVVRLLAQSALERLRGGLPASHIVQLTRQRRMPAEIADFISASFYRGELLTEKDHRHTGPLFASPMAFVDTGGLPDRVRRESGGRRTEGRGHRGPFNPCEARLLARLAAFYHHRGSEWVVIVPYLAQRLEVIRHLTPLIGDSQLADASVGSVDSYQGGERDIVLYGFTRSNAEGRIGFLKELRRANVAFTRAKSQLVMVGDLGTLMRADDPGFRTLMGELHRHLLDRGDLRDHKDVMAALDEALPDMGRAARGSSSEGGRP